MNTSAKRKQVERPISQGERIRKREKVDGLLEAINLGWSFSDDR